MSSKILLPIVCAVFPVLIFTTGCMTGRTTRQSSTFNTVHDNILIRPLNEGSKPIARRSGNVAMVSFLDNSDETTARFAPVISDSNSPESSINPTGNDYSAPVMTLAEFESLALDNNPTIQELAATTQKAAGFRTQVSLRPNPTVGYQAIQLADLGTDQHLAFIDQEFVRGGKLDLNRQVLNETLRAQLLELDTQKLRVVSDIRIKFYEALGAQQRMELISAFGGVVEKGLELAQLRQDALEGSKVDVLQSKIQKNELDLARRQSQIAFDAGWRELAALAGKPELSPVRIDGVLPQHVESIDWNSRASAMVASSPEFEAAQARISRAQANLRRQGVQSIPNVTAQLAAGVDNATGSGLINLQVGAPIPVFNQNQGNIAAARAEYCRAVMESQRIENAIKARLAAVSKDYDSASAAIRLYADEILPAAQESLDLAEVAYKAGETSFVQVLVARRTYFDSNLQYVVAQTLLAQAQAKVDGSVLTGALDPVKDESGDDSLRGLTFSQQ